MSTQPQPIIDSVFEDNTGTWQYIVSDPTTKDAVLIDSVLDYNPTTNTITNTNAERLLSLISERGYNIVAILETHAHADHLTAARYIQQRLLKGNGAPLAPVCIGKRITQVQATFAVKYGVSVHEYDGVFDRLLDDDEEFPIGNLVCRVLHLPGHTPDHVGYLIGNNVFVGDSLFQPDVGSARCDFPGGDANALYHSVVDKLYSLPEDCRIYVGHDYPPGGSGRTEARAFATVAEQRKENKHIRDDVAEDQFIAWRKERDSNLAEPRLLHQSLQFNIRAGRLPEATEHGHRFLHVPLKVSDDVWNWGFAPQG